MKLATVNPRMDLNMEALLSKEVSYRFFNYLIILWGWLLMNFPVTNFIYSIVSYFRSFNLKELYKVPFTN